MTSDTLVEEKLFPMKLLERELRCRINNCHDIAAHGSNATKAKQRACANALGDFLSWLRETAK